MMRLRPRWAGYALAALLCAAALAPAGAQQRLSLALAAADYPVTPGDTYELSFLPATAARVDAMTRLSELVVVAGDYSVDLGAFGVLDARGLNLNGFRRRIAALVTEAYPGSNPALHLTGVGTFEVHLRGAVETAGYAATWGLGRLSEVVAGLLTAHASLRDVRIERGAEAQVYDLFRAQRFGIRSQDPYLLPGDRICVSRREREVTIGGQVWRPGSYQLAAGEGLAELVAFADGFTPRADLERVRLESLGSAPAPTAEDAGERAAGAAILDCDGAPRPAPSSAPAAERGATRYAAWGAELARAPLRDGDVVTVANRDALLPAVFFEGAVAAAAPGGRIAHRYRPGETLFDALQKIRDSIVPGADLTNATFARRGEPDAPIDLELLLHGGSRAGDRGLQPMDRIIIPAQRFEVALRGEVTQARQLTVSPVTRLNDVVEAVRTQYTSIRRIAVESPGGQRRTYDLFRWRRFGELAHNPLLAPGATITFRERERAVRLAGEVRRPGRYQLLAGEGLPELIEQYGAGFTLAADPTRVVISRLSAAGDGAGRESIAVDFAAGGAPPLLDEDSILVRAVPSPVVYLEGALEQPTPTTVTTTRTSGEVDQIATATERELVAATRTTGTARRVVPYWPGVTVFDVLFPLRAEIRHDADLGAGYVLRADVRLAVDLERLLFAGGRDDDIPLQPYDKVVVPVRRLSVTVAGAVQAPGVFPYLPGRSADYYVRLAGGTVPAGGDGSRATVTDRLGREKEPSAPVAPDDQIFVPAESFAFSQIIAPAATLGALVISFVALVLAIDSQ